MVLSTLRGEGREEGGVSGAGKEGNTKGHFCYEQGSATIMLGNPSTGTNCHFGILTNLAITVNGPAECGATISLVNIFWFDVVCRLPLGFDAHRRASRTNPPQINLCMQFSTSTRTSMAHQTTHQWHINVKSKRTSTASTLHMEWCEDEW